MSTFRVFRLAVLASVVASISLLAHASEPRIGVVDSSNLSELAGNISPRLSEAKDLGLAPAEKTIQRLSLRFNMTSTQQAALSQLLIDQQNPASPKYHQWLTPEQFGAHFGLAADDLAQVSQWLTSQGFTVTSVARGGEFIQFSGTVGQANRAFHTQLHSVQLGSETHLANYSAPMLPKAIATVTAAVTGLTDFTMKPHVIKRVIPGNDVTSNGVQPEYTSSLSGSHFVAPGDFYTIYDETPALAAGLNGTGIKIAVVGQTDVYSADIATFRSVSGLTANAYTTVFDGSDPGYSTNADDIIESELDLEWAGATAPSASLLFITSTDAIDGSLTYAVDQNLAPIISDSYGACESAVGETDLVYYETLLQMAATEGITIVAASGDSGATDCDTKIASHGLAVDFPADSPFVTGVGGTEFNENGGTYWSSTNGAYQGSALSHIPEMAWNDSLASSLGAGGGGASGYFSKPSWQVGTGVPSDFSRDVPDVSLNASALHDPYIICYQGYCTNGYRANDTTLFVVGGTSVGAPSFAGLLALVEQKTGKRIGVANPTIYALANSSVYGPLVFHDVTVGYNASPCTTGTQNCLNTVSPGGYYSAAYCLNASFANCAANVMADYFAANGYDQATGWGSVDAFNMITAWPLVTALATTGGQSASYTALTSSVATVTQGTNVSLTATVTAAQTTTSTPTGNVEFEVDGVGYGSTALNGNDVATYSLSTTALSPGSHTVQATYLGDTTFAGSKAAFVLNVNSITTPDFTISPSTATVTVTHGQGAPGVAYTISALNGFTGSVSLVASATSSLQAETSFSVNPVVLTTAAPSGQTTFNLFAYYPGAGLTPASHKVAGRTLQRGTIALEAGLSLVGALLMILLPRRRKLAGVMLALLAVVMVGVSGCSSATTNTGVTASTPTPPGTYTMIISATGTVNGAPLTHTATLTVTVQ